VGVHHAVGDAEEPVARFQAVPVAADGQVGELAGAQAVAHGVEHRELEGVAVDGVVEGVAADLVGRLDQARHRDPPAVQAQRWQQTPLHLGGQGDLLAAAQRRVGVGALAPGDQQRSDHPGQAVGQRPGFVIEVDEGDGHHTQARRPVDHDAPQPPAAFSGLVPLAGGGERPATGGVVHGDRRPLRRPRDRHQAPLLVVGHVHRQVLHPEQRRSSGEERPQLVRGRPS